MRGKLNKTDLDDENLFELEISFAADLLGSFARIRGLSAISLAGSPAGCGISGTAGTVTTTAAAAAMSSYLNRKRKQTMPQKIVRLHKGKRRRGAHQNENQLSTLLDQLEENPLRDQASQEVGPLKGDFNWTTVFDDFGSGTGGDTLLDTGTAPLLSPTQLSLNDSASSLFNLAFGSLVSGTGAGRLAPSGRGESNENLFTVGADAADFAPPLTASYVESDEMSASGSPHQDDMDKLLMGDSFFQSLADDVAGLDDHPSISIDEFFHAACSSSSSTSGAGGGGGGLDLTVQGHGISAPPHWAPVGADLETILCESQDSNLSSATSR